MMKPRGRFSRIAHLLLALVVLGLAVGATGCRQSVGGVPVQHSGGGAKADDAPDVALTLTAVESAVPVVGPWHWNVTLLDSAGAPIEGALVDVRGDMNHAGMIPIESVAVDQGDGAYRADFEWTMAGDWIVTVTAQLPDGRVKSETFEYSVAVD